MELAPPRMAVDGYEIELKLSVSHDVVEPRLSAAGFTLESSVHQHDVYFDAPHRSFAHTDEALRLRTVTAGDSQRAMLTYKGPRLDSPAKHRREIVAAIPEPDMLRAIFKAVGLHPAGEVVKTRRTYRQDQVSVALDEVDGLGEFIEVERLTDGPSSAEAAVFETVEALGLADRDPIEVSYLELLESDS